MNIRDFFWAYEGVWAESNKSSDPSTNDQCVDNWRIYNRKVIQAPDIFGNPPVIWENYQADYYDKIPNTPEGVPQLGDVVIWGTKYGKYGHIAICTEIANTKTFTSFDQNDPVGEPCHFQPHTYTGVLGWLRPKNQLAILPPQEDTSVADKIADLETKVKSLNESLARTQLENNELRTALANQERDNGDLAAQLVQARTERDTALREKEEATGKVVALESSITTIQKENEGLKEALVASQVEGIDQFSAWQLIIKGLAKLIHK